MEENALKTCPFCREQIRTEAIKCRFCGEWLEVPSQPPVRVPDAIPLPSQPQPDAAPAPRKPSKISSHADSIPGGLPALKAWFKKHTKPESLTQIPPLLDHIRTPQTAEPQQADDAPPSVNANQRKVRIIAEVAIVIVLLFHGYIGWQKISKEPVGGNFTRTDIVLSWAQVSVINTIADIFLTPIGIGGVILLGYLYHNLRTRRSYPKKFHVRKAQGPPFLGPFTIEELRIECETGRIDPGWVAIEAKGHSYWSLKKIQNDQCLTVDSLLTTSHDMSIYILQNDETKGPYTVDQLRSMWRSDEVTGDTLYCKEGYEAWLPLRGIVGQLEQPPPIPQNSSSLSSESESISSTHPVDGRLPKIFTFLSVGLLALCATVLVLAIAKINTSNAHKFGELIAQIFISSCFLSWFIWSITGKRKGADLLIFSVVCSLEVAVSVYYFRISFQQAKQSNRNLATNLLDAFDQAAKGKEFYLKPSGTVEENAYMQIIAGFNREFLRYLDNMESDISALKQKNIFQRGLFTNKTDLADEATKRVATQNIIKKYQLGVPPMVEAARAKLTSLRISDETKRGALEGFDQSTKTDLLQVDTMFTLRLRGEQAELDLLQFLAGAFDDYFLETNAIVFRTSMNRKKYGDFLKSIQDTVKEQEALQKHALDAAETVKSKIRKWGK